MIKPYVQVKYKRAGSTGNNMPTKSNEPTGNKSSGKVTSGKATSETPKEKYLKSIKRKVEGSAQEYSEMINYIRHLEREVYGQPRSPFPPREIYLMECSSYNYEELYRGDLISIHRLTPTSSKIRLKPRQERILKEVSKDKPLIVNVDDQSGYSAPEYVRTYCHAAQECYPEKRAIFAKCKQRPRGTTDYIQQLYILPPESAASFTEKWVHRNHNTKKQA